MQAVQTRRPAKPALMTWITPCLTVRDVSESIDYYERTFGFEKGETMSGPDGSLVFGQLKYEGSVVVMLGRQGAPSCKSKSPASSNVDCPIGLYVYCENVDDLYRRAEQAGATVISEPADMFWGDRTATFEDLDGYRWTFSTNVADFDPSKAPK